jgi:hypothetical protein
LLRQIDRASESNEKRSPTMEERANNIFNTLKQKGDIIKFDYIDKL